VVGEKHEVEIGRKMGRMIKGNRKEEGGRKKSETKKK
jgi:hypothetical protein